jgi:prepilin-type N-terminal cleavage/methylation domain-containing protein/prepilin-type processing-associated H-X9-DG protein
MNPQPRIRNAKASAFTLIELLVVIAIIAILAAILFPVFAKAREKARQTACLSNTKQMGLGIMQYVQDYDETYPMGSFSSSGVGMTAAEVAIDRWYKAIVPYTKNTDIRSCPSAPAQPVNTYQTNYGIHSDICKRVNQPPAADAVTPESLIVNTAGTLLLGDAQTIDMTTVNRTDSTTWLKAETNAAVDWDMKGLRFFSSSTSYFTNTDPSNGRWPAARHNGGTNLTYCDGHAKWMKIEQLTGVTAARPNGWPYLDPNNVWDNN